MACVKKEGGACRERVRETKAYYALTLRVYIEVRTLYVVFLFGFRLCMQISSVNSCQRMLLT